jgi:1-acyl-sn-glycerol-3-phosphate acyltransferase
MTFKTPIKIVKFRSGGIIGNIFKNIHHIYLDPNTHDRTQRLIQDVTSAITSGFSVLIFPEGTAGDKDRCWRQLLPFKSGAFILSKQLNLSIVPVLISGGQYKNSYVNYGPIRIHYLDPIQPHLYTLEQLKDVTHTTMSHHLNSI